MKIVALHRALAFILAIFIVAHLGNHVALFWGLDQHLALQEKLRAFYQNPMVEPVLIGGFTIQLFVGARLLFRRGWPRRFWPRVQALSGAILVLFLIQHVGAALYTRSFYTDVDTNVYWAAAVVSRMPFVLYFAPYYVLGVAAIFLHLAAYFAIKQRATKVAYVVSAVGVVLSISLVATMCGAIYPVDLPKPYEGYLDDQSF